MMRSRDYAEKKKGVGGGVPRNKNEESQVKMVDMISEYTVIVSKKTVKIARCA